MQVVYLHFCMVTTQCTHLCTLYIHKSSERLHCFQAHDTLFQALAWNSMYHLQQASVRKNADRCLAMCDQKKGRGASPSPIGSRSSCSTCCYSSQPCFMLFVPLFKLRCGWFNDFRCYYWGLRLVSVTHCPRNVVRIVRVVLGVS